MIYKKWPYKFFLYTVILNIIVAFIVFQSTIFKIYSIQIMISAIAASMFLILGLSFGILAYRKKETNDFKKNLGLFGNLGILILTIIIQVLGNV